MSDYLNQLLKFYQNKITTFSLLISVKSPLEKTRYDTSLGLLTKKFVGLLRSAPDGVSIIIIIYHTGIHAQKMMKSVNF